MGCTYEINGSSYDDANQMAIYDATITGTHDGDRGQRSLRPPHVLGAVCGRW